jgi:hypothetical protein
MAEEPQELQANLAEYREQLQQACSPHRLVMLEYMFVLAACASIPSKFRQRGFLVCAVGGAASR